jgi:hypothetical protein
MGVGTTSPWAKLSINPISADGSAPALAIGSSTATSFVVTNAGKVGAGTTTPTATLSIGATTGNGLQFSGTNSSYFNINADGEITAGNNKSQTFQTTYRFGNGIGGPNGGNGDFFVIDAGSDNTNVGAFRVGSEFIVKKSITGTGGQVGVGTTTPPGSIGSQYTALTSFSASSPQLALSAGAGLAQWAFRNAGGNFYLSTTTVAGTSTTTLAALSINGTTGGLSLGTTTAGSLKVNSSGLVYADPSGGGAGYSTVTDDTNGTLTQRSTLSFLGTGINCVDNAGNSSTDCTVNAGAATAAGNNNEIQFNTGDALDSDTAFVWDNANNRLGVGTSTPLATLSASSTSDTIATAIFDQRGLGGLLTLQQAGTDKLTVANSGALSIFTTTGDTVKTSTGGSKVVDFDYTGSTFASTTASNGNVTINDGVINGQGVISATTTVTNANVGVGGHAILRTNGQYVIIHGGGSATASVWNGRTSGTMSALATNVVSAGSVGAGSISLKRPDGRYLIIQGGATTATSVFDPMGVVAVTAGPALTGSAATGTAAALLPNGRYLVLVGATANWGVYDPGLTPSAGYTNVSSGGTTWGAGTHILQRDDGTFLIYAGGTTQTFIYNPYQGANGAMIAGPTSPTQVTGGAFSIRRADGLFLTLPGIANQSFVYNPVGTTTTNALGSFSGNLGVGPTGALSEGAAQTMWRQDGRYMLITATTSGSALLTNVVDPGAGLPGSAGAQNPIFTTSGVPTMTAGAVGLGMSAFMMPDGRYAIIRGAGNTIDIYDMNFETGVNTSGTNEAYYESECIASPSLSPNSTLNWTSNQEGEIKVYARTATSPSLCSSATYIPIGNSGDLIGATSTANNMVQFKFEFKRELPKFLDQEWGLRKGGITRYRRVNADPVLFDVRVDNGAVLHRSQFDFGNSISSTTAPASGPVVVNIRNDSNRNNALALIQSYYDTTTNTTNAGYANGTTTSHAIMTTGTASTTLVIKRPDGKWIVIAGNTTANAMVYDEATQAFTANATVPTTQIGIGALSFKRPDGKFLIVTASGVASSTTNIYDPIANTFTAGPGLASQTGTTGAGEGASAISLPNGRVLIMHGGGTSASSIYDPVNNSMTVGPQALSAATTVTTVGSGSLWIPRQNGTYLFLPGMATTMQPSPAGASCAAVRTTTNIFNPYTMRFSFTGAPAQTAGGTGPGAFAFQRKDGQWVIIKGGATAINCASVNTTQIYNPISNQALVAGPTFTAPNIGPGPGAHAIPRPDGSWLIVHGMPIMATTSVPRTGELGIVGTTTTHIYVEEAGGLTSVGDQSTIGAFIPGPSYISNTASGATSFQRADGKFVTISGAATTTTSTAVQVYDAGWVASGIYKSEQMDLSPVGTKLTSNSTLVWKSNMSSTPTGGISAEVRTARNQAELGTSSPRQIVNGGLINPDTDDAWLQINFNFRRTFSSYGGIYTDVWGSNTMAYPLRPFVTPVLYEYKVSEDKDIINLQADGLSVFRVSTNGDVYTQAGGTINTSGADLAERYTSQETLEFGDVVVIDPLNDHAVKKSKYQYEPTMVGVVSTDPGFISGAYTENSYPIGLIGRVPVKVSTENGNIQVGDYLTTSSVPGVAMKATLSGRVLGKALESIDPSKLEDCPASDLYIPGRKCTKIMMFVNLIDYGGLSVDTAMSDWKMLREAKLMKEAQDMGLSYTPSADGRLATSSPIATVSQHDAEILEFLTLLKADRQNGVVSSSELFTDKLSVVTRIISPEIITKIVKSEKIEGLDVNVNNINTKTLTTETISGPGGLSMSLVDGKLVIRGRRLVTTIATTTNNIATTTDITNVDMASSTENNLANVIFSTDTASTTEDISTTTDTISTTTPDVLVTEEYEEVITISFDTEGNAYFAGEVVADKVSTGGLAVTGVASFAGGLEVNSIGNASTTIAMLSDVDFFGRPYFTSDTGGTAVIKGGAKTVDVVFDREYVATPIVNASMVFGTSTEDADIEAIFEKGVRFVVTNRTEKGFTIRINTNLEEDVEFSWTAIAVKDAKVFTSRSADITPIVENVDTATTTPVVTGDNGTTTPIVIDNSTTTQPVIDNSTTTPEVLGGNSSTTPITNSEQNTVNQNSSVGGIDNITTQPIEEAPLPPSEEAPSN